MGVSFLAGCRYRPVPGVVKAQPQHRLGHLSPILSDNQVGAAAVDEVLGHRSAVTVPAVVGAAYAEIATGIDMRLNLDCPPCDRLPAFQDGVHHRCREQDGSLFIFGCTSILRR